MVFFSPNTDVLLLVIATVTSCWRTRPFPWPLELWGQCKYESHRDRKSKGFASLTCIHWRWQHWKVLSYRQSNLAASQHEGRQRFNHFSADAGRMPFLPPNQQCQSTEGNIDMYMDMDSHDILSQSSKGMRYLSLSAICLQKIFGRSSECWRPSLNCDRRSCAGIWQKVTSTSYPWSSEAMGDFIFPLKPSLKLKF